MSALSKITSKMPPFVKVVSLYVLAWLSLFFALQIPSFINITFHGVNNSSKTVAVKQQVVVSKTIIDGEPLVLRIDRLGINLPIRNGAYNSATDEWTLSDDAVYFITTTNLPNNQRGNTFLYGHNRDSVLGSMSSISVGDIAIVETTKNHVFKYVYTHDAFVSPNDKSVLSDNPETPRLTIMTCDGVWSQSRRLMYFNLQEAA